jgi:hypothetical protein
MRRGLPQRFDLGGPVRAAGALVVVQEPAAIGAARPKHPELAHVDDPSVRWAGAAVLPHLTGWPVYGTVGPARLSLTCPGQLARASVPDHVTCLPNRVLSPIHSPSSSAAPAVARRDGPSAQTGLAGSFL